ncbi:M20/M25/M40 family metallo-hydrolase [Rubinisphaera italica]|uniref:Peptidase M20 dimerisation domain-containing protein n=1 Tax=Rubinisphaera italica TaxID=2527969 RepID=A0A5C5XLF1_9PLAN|nr:M20/M25/M40 family metallo-hydrolase [Rubinisphaera italica]TWT64046.1 hypothetical protein Pan54_48070 [Rubinisphaera italica]
MIGHQNESLPGENLGGSFLYAPVANSWVKAGFGSTHKAREPTRVTTDSTRLAEWGIWCNCWVTVPKARSTAALKSMLEAVCPPGIRMEFKDFHGCEGLVFNTSGDHFQAASRAIAHAFGKEPVFIREGGSIPVVASFEEIYGVETLLLGWGLNSDNLHSPNEHFHLANFHRGTLASAK